MLTSNSYALLIGINDYTTYDASAGRPKGTSDLPGALNDARAFYRECRDLGIPPENICVLTSPRLSPADLEGDGSSPGVITGEATRAEILDRVAWLASNLGAPSQPTGLLTYSGHGDFIERDGLVLCPADVERGGRDGLKNAISYGELERIVRRFGASANLTVLLDTCHSGAGASPLSSAPEEGKGARASLTHRPIPASLLGARAPSARISDRTLAACRRDELAHQSKFSGVDRGAFSWAVGAVLNQWKTVQDRDNVRRTLSYGELVTRADRLLKSLSFPQSPELYGAMELPELAFLQQGLDVRPGACSPQPDVAPCVRQLDPGSRGYTLYQLSINSTVFASILVANTTQTIGGVTYTAGTEYWSMNTTGPGTSNVTMTTSGSLDWPGGGSIPDFPVASALPTFTMPSSVTWGSLGTDPSGVHIKSSTGLKEGIKFNLSYNSMTQVWSGSVTFYQTVVNAGSASAYVLTSGGTLTYTSGSVSPPSNTSWYAVTLNP